ncbi:hypothetical protein AMC94_27755 [Pseudomonas amygdali pv. aesculi]|nr:hypothetical protein AL041_20630 [Pseudomonas amygdali pv. aesculi]KWT18133.1 hypothetical protein AL042_03225 [Pseudomonas amygdali pv. aesculi]KWT25110.1 hypothetical protein AL043_19825 [Pseudomonas amygdali pv. aesculi]KWT31743.1 hypothetical protein AL044_10805 [Pseudomonas amygdali pv. aesculi]KWT35069.1 hypothetical protein AMC94_27755 [Pseudomonas amygdali pv. aesculi]
MNSRVSFDECWLSLDAHLLQDGPTAHEDLDKALKEALIYSIFRPCNALEALIYQGVTAGF